MLKSKFKIRQQPETNSEKLKNPVKLEASTSSCREGTLGQGGFTSQKSLGRLVGSRRHEVRGLSPQGDLLGCHPLMGPVHCFAWCLSVSC